jgi:MATE family multidrug resistance protein
MGIKGAPIAINISSFCLVIMIFYYIYIMKIYVDTWPGWSLESLYDWEVYLKLAVPGVSLILIEWSSFEIATFASGLLGTVELDVMSIVQQVLYIFFQFPLGLAMAGNIHIGHLLGANKPDEAKNATKVLYVINRE